MSGVGGVGGKPVALVSMPTLGGMFPSFQLALLKPTLEREGFGVETHSLFLRFGERIGWRLNDVLATVYPCMVGEWIWSKAAFGDFADDGQYLDRYRSNLEEICDQAGTGLDDILRIREEEAPAFVEWAATEIDWSAYGVVGFTVVFQQMVASLALAKAIKARHPDLPVIFGGATFEDDIASEVLRRNPEVDLVHCGDADLSLPDLVRRLYAGESLGGLRGVMWRDGDRIAYEGRAPNLEDLDRTPVPDFDEYFDVRAATGYDDFHGTSEVMLPIETARGCWYGMKNHCTFCGLNRAGMDYRRKSPEQVLDMLKVLSRRYGTRYFNAIDNILAPAYVSRLFGRLAEAHTDLRLHYEIRPTVNRVQLGALRRGGLTSVQPGVESFSTHVLDLMKKSTTGMKNVELVKWTTYYGITNLYNILYGFPGETEEDYRQQAHLIRRIIHLQPPYAMAVARPDRGSPMFERPDEHSISLLRPSACYRHIYPPEYNLRRAAYFFEHEVGADLPVDGHRECAALVAEWKAQWRNGDRPYLRYVKSWDSVSIHDGRGLKPRHLRFDDREAALYELCVDALSREEIGERIGEDGDWVDGALRHFVDEDLMVFLDGKYLALALPDNPYY
jgi:ribosomal peptide maturation radical SAM protein 1